MAWLTGRVVFAGASTILKRAIAITQIRSAAVVARAQESSQPEPEDEEDGDNRDWLESVVRRQMIRKLQNVYLSCQQKLYRILIVNSEDTK